MKMFKINGVGIGEGFPPYIIAEMSANHGGSIKRAKETILAAQKSGASAIKLQTYTAETMTIKSDKPDFKINDGLWKGYTLYDLYHEAHTPYEWHEELFSFAEKLGITIFSTPFDESAIELLENLNSPAYKIASFELTDLVLIEEIAKLKKPMLVSTGMGSLDEIGDAVETIKKIGNSQILLFHCISSYPAPTEDSHLKNLNFLAKEFDTLIGLSDHTTNNIASILSIGLGACAIEKHFKVDETDCGPDSSFSLLPNDLTNLVDDCNAAWSSLGHDQFKRPTIEKNNKIFRRSLYFVKDLKKGSILSKSDVRRIRPGFGLSPKYLNQIIGKKMIKSVEVGDPVTFECFDSPQ